MHIHGEAENSTGKVVQRIHERCIALTMLVDILLHKRRHTMSKSGLVAMQYVRCSYSVARASSLE